MFYIDKNTEITDQTLLKIIGEFQMKNLPKMTKWGNYYSGRHDILNKQYNDSTKPCNRIITNYCATITNNYLGYITGNPIVYDIDDENILKVLHYNDYQEQDKELLRNALIYGYSAELCWIDEDSKIRFNTLDSKYTIPVYYNTVERDNLALVIRYYPQDTISNNPDYIVEVYMADCTKVYKSDQALSTLILLDTKPNYFHQVPVTIMPLYENWVSCFDSIMGLNDAYNSVLSGEIDDYDSFADAYLVMSGIQNQITKEDMEAMREKKVLVFPDGGSAEYLTKNISDAQTENILNNIKKNIYLVSNCVDFSDDAFGTSSGISMKMKLLGMENISGVIEKHMTKALQKRIELICSILSITSGEEEWREASFKFTRNIPIDTSSEVQNIMSLRGLVSDRTLLSQLTFVKDIDKEMEDVKKQKEEYLSLYGEGQI